MRAVAAFARWNADDRAPLLILGEPGSGRQFIARLLHDSGSRQGDGFASIPAGALTVARLRSEIHRHGTIVISGLELLPGEVAAALPRLMRAGGGRVIATAVPACDHAAFDGLVIEVPPLRERREDIPVLASQFLARAMSPSALEGLLNYAWPGNVRELRETCEWIARTCRCRTVKRGCLPARVLASVAGEKKQEIVRLDAPCLDDRIARFEAEIITGALEAASYNRSRAARLLGIKRSTLVDRIRRLGVGGADEAHEPVCA
jgi:two-component system nitrogen regulation response regulator GlnG